MKRFEVVTWGFALGAFIVSMAASRPQVNPGEAFLIQFEYKDAPPDKFRLWYDGGIVKNYSNTEVILGKKANADGTFTYTLSAPPLDLKNHTYFISVYNQEGEPVKSYLDETKSEVMEIQPQCNLYQVVKK